MVAKAPDIAQKVDILLGNLEDAVPVERKQAAREGLITVGRDIDLGDTALWVRINSLESPWVLDDVTQIVTEIGHKLDGDHGPEGRGRRGTSTTWTACSPSSRRRPSIERPIMLHALLETALGVNNIEEIATAEPAHAGHEPRPGRPRRARAG